MAKQKRVPEWFAECCTYSGWPQMPMAHGPFGKDRLTTKERTFLKGVPLLNNVQTKNAIREAHTMGSRCMSYISFLDLYVHTEGFENGTARVPWDPKTPQVLVVDRDGRFVNTPMDGTWRMWRYQVCANTKEYEIAALKLAKMRMDLGADGLFVDNSTRREDCYGHGLPIGHSDSYRQVLASIPRWKSRKLVDSKHPEELHRMGVKPDFVRHKRLSDLPVHRHMYPGLSHEEAYAKLLGKVRKLVKSYGEDKILTINGRTGAQHADGVMLESFVYSWASKGPRTDWAGLKKQAKELGKTLVPGTRVIALSYVGNTPRPAAEDALFASSAAYLLGYIWSGGAGLCSKLGDTMMRLALGKRLTKLTEKNEIAHSYFENGLVVVNGGKRRRTVTIPVPRRVEGGPMTNLIEDKTVTPNEAGYRINLPGQGGRILLRRA